MTTAPSEARVALAELSEITRAELAVVVATLRQAGLTPPQFKTALADLLPSLGTEYHSAAAAIAADWYDDLREAGGVRGRFVAEPIGPPTPQRWDALAGWASGPLFAAEPDWGTALSLVAGGLQRTVANGHRLTIVENTKRDPQAKGWTRVARPGACGFCRMLADRGAVYTESTVTFRSHDSCGCVASPTWASNVVKVSREPYRQSQRRRSEATRRADNARAREFIRDRYGDQ